MTDVLILGPVLVRSRERTATPSSALTRAIIGVLALAGDAGVSVAVLTESAWPRRKQQVGAKALVVAVHRARQWLAEHTDGAARIERTTIGYVLRGVQIDAHRFTRLTERPDRLAEALSLWRGEPLADVVTGDAVAPAIAALARARLAATVRYGRSLLAAGRANDAVTAVTPLAETYPLDEPLHAVLIEALAVAGRQAEALDHYERLRLRLAEDLGVDPSRELSGTLVRILRQEIPAATPEPAVPVTAGLVPAQLPPDVGAFAGRLVQLGQLREMTGGSVVITALAGLGGVGKTTLAVHWAREAAPNYPDGQLYVDLHGYAHVEPMPSIEALGRFLRALGVAAERVPVEVDEATALFRTLLADRRVLVVLDNAATADQVRPLLPGSPGSLVLVTSRDRLDGLVAREGARRLNLGVFRPHESIELLAALVGADRVAAEPEATAELADLCGHLPLALRIVGAQLIGLPDLTIADQVRALRVDRLGELAIAADPMSSVRAVFDLSYARLSDVDRRVFRLLGVVPGTDDISPEAVAVLCDADVEPALARLVSAHLVGRTDGRYGLHDLLCDYAAERFDSEESDRTSPVDRLCRWYLDMADAAARLLYPNEPRLPVPANAREFTDRAAAQDWLRTESQQLLAVVEHTAKHGPAEVSWLIVDAIRRSTQGLTTVELIRAVETAHAAATRAGDPAGIASTEFSLTLIHIGGWSMDRAKGHAANALSAAREAGWAEGVAAALNLIARTMVDGGDLRGAAELLRESIDHSERHGLTGRAMTATNTLAHVYLYMGQVRRAVEHFQRALAAQRQVGDTGMISPTLDGYAQAQREMGQLHEALATLDEAVTLNKGSGDGRNEFVIWMHKAFVNIDLGRYEWVREFDTNQLAVIRNQGKERYIGISRFAIALADLRQGRAAEAIEAFRALTTLTRQLGLLANEINSLIGWAQAAHDLGDDADALTRAQNALALAHRHQYALCEAQALAVLASVHLKHRRLDWAAMHAERALVICKEGGARLTEARTLQLLSDIRCAQGHDVTAASLLRAARQMFTDMDVPMPGTGMGGLRQSSSSRHAVSARLARSCPVGAVSSMPRTLPICSSRRPTLLWCRCSTSAARRTEPVAQ